MLLVNQPGNLNTFLPFDKHIVVTLTLETSKKDQERG